MWVTSSPVWVTPAIAILEPDEFAERGGRDRRARRAFDGVANIDM